MYIKVKVAIPFVLIAFLVGVAGCTAEEPHNTAQVVNQMPEQTPGEMPEQISEQIPEQPQDETTDQDSENRQPMDEPSEGQLADEPPPAIFSLRIGDALLSLGDWDDKADLAEMLGPPVDEQIIELEDADPFTGSLLKKLTYDGLQIDLFSPQHNGETFWILQMIVDKEGFPTSEGIEVGSTWEAVQAAYPAITKESDRIYSESQYEYLQFEIEEGLVTKINIVGSL